MNLTGKQVRQLQAALRDAFPHRADLTRVVRFGLDRSLEAVTAGDTYDQVIFTLIEWAEAQNQLPALLQAACEENPGNVALRSMCDTLLASIVPPPPAPPDTPRPAGSAAAAAVAQPILLQALIGSRGCTLRIMLALVGLLTLGAMSAALAGWFRPFLPPPPVTPTPILTTLPVPTNRPSPSASPNQPLSPTGAPTSTLVQVIPTPPPATPTASSILLATATPGIDGTVVAAETATAQASHPGGTPVQVPSLSATPRAATRVTPPRGAASTATPTPKRVPPPSATLPLQSTQTAVPTPSVPPLAPTRPPNTNTPVPATATVLPPAPIVTPSIPASPGATATACPWDPPTSSFIGGIYARSEVRTGLGCSIVPYEVGVPQGAVQSFTHGYLFRDSVLNLIFVLVQSTATPVAGTWQGFADPLPGATPGPAASLNQLLANQPAVSAELGAAKEVPQLRVEADRFYAVAQPFQNGYILWANGYPVFVLYAATDRWDSYNPPP